MKHILTALSLINFLAGLAQTKPIEQPYLKQQWETVYETNGCLVGKQYIKDKKFGGEGCVMTNNEHWNSLFSNNKQQLTYFFISHFSDTSTTEVHTCPFFNATRGELAVYALQNIHGKNWYDFNYFTAYKNKDYTDTENPQVWLQAILNDPKQREKLAQYWRDELEN